MMMSLLRQHLFCPLLINLCLLLGLSSSAVAQALHVNALPTGPDGLYGQFLQEAQGPLQLEQAVELFAQGQGQPGNSPVLNFGIGSAPTWLQLQLVNPTSEPIPLVVISGITWVDNLQLSLLQSGKELERWNSGDALAGAKQLVPGIGFVTRLLIPSGNSELYLRTESSDPLVIPIELMSEENYLARRLEYRFVYGLIYGFLLSMIIYNSMLFIGLRDRSYLLYSLYLGVFALLNLAYTGHGFAWFWPDSPQWQNHVIFVLMLLFGCCGLAFTSSFLSLADYAPKSRHWLQGLAAFGVVSLSISLLLGSQSLEALSTFVFCLLATASMLLLGLISIRNRHVAGNYYLAGTFCGLLGTGISILTVWGALPFNNWNYGAIKLGIIAQAILLALGLSHKVRQQQKKKLQAERMAERDPLTGLHNRRGFNEQTIATWSTAVRKNRPLSLIMLDLDHFKSINDLYGHAIGDHALELTARLLEKTCRAGDVVARWGGEEFLLMLPETALNEAQALAERLRREISALAPANDSRGVTLSASFGVIERSAQTSLEQLINQADRLLYAAKHAGRNRVCIET